MGGHVGREGVGKETCERLASSPGVNRKKNKGIKHRNPDKRRARLVVAMRVYRGTLKRPEMCERCGIECKPDAHHHDYTKPLDVEWLCGPCHRDADREDAAEDTRMYMGKLTAEDVRQIRAMASSGSSNVLIARRFSISPSTVGRIVRGHTWKSIA
jgi:hypothetical protein